MKLLALILVATVAPAPSAAARAPAHQTLFLDAISTHVGGGRVPTNTVGHLESAGGVLRDAHGRAVGRFAFTCRTTAVLADNDAREHCTGWGRTPDAASTSPARAAGATPPTRGRSPPRVAPTGALTAGSSRATSAIGSRC
jgi:hypothetical protein